MGTREVVYYLNDLGPDTCDVPAEVRAYPLIFWYNRSLAA